MLSPEAEILGTPVHKFLSNLSFYVTDLVFNSDNLSSIAIINVDGILHLVIIGVFLVVSFEHACCFIFQFLRFLPLLLGLTLLDIQLLRVSVDVAICILNSCLEAGVLAVPLAGEVLWGKCDNLTDAFGEIVEDFLAVWIDQNFSDLCLELLVRANTFFD